MSTNQLQRVALEKNFFWYGSLVVNETNYFSFFEVKAKRDVPDAPNTIGLYTGDVPALPFTETDSLHVTFSIRNNIGSTQAHFIICEANLAGAELQHVLESYPTPPPNVTVTNDHGEWQFTLQDKVYILRSLLIIIPIGQLRKYVKDA